MGVFDDVTGGGGVSGGPSGGGGSFSGVKPGWLDELDKLALLQQQKTNGPQSNPGHYGTFNPDGMGQSRGGASAPPSQGGKPGWLELLEAGADPNYVSQVLSSTYGHNTIGDAAGTRIGARGAFNKDTWAGGGMGPHGGGGQSGPAMSAGIQGPQAPQGDAPGSPGWDYHHKYQLDQNANADRSRHTADQEAQLALKQKYALQLLGSLGMGGGNGQMHSSSTSQQVVDHAGFKSPMTLQQTETRDYSPQERAALLQAIMGGL